MGARTKKIGLSGKISQVLMITVVPVLSILRAGSERPPRQTKRRAILSSKAGVKADFGRVSHLRPGLIQEKVKSRLESPVNVVYI